MTACSFTVPPPPALLPSPPGAQKSQIVFKPNPYCLPKCMIFQNISDATKRREEFKRGRTEKVRVAQRATALVLQRLDSPPRQLLRHTAVGGVAGEQHLHARYAVRSTNWIVRWRRRSRQRSPPRGGCATCRPRRPSSAPLRRGPSGSAAPLRCRRPPDARPHGRPSWGPSRRARSSEGPTHKVVCERHSLPRLRLGGISAISQLHTRQGWVGRDLRAYLADISAASRLHLG